MNRRERRAQWQAARRVASAHHLGYAGTGSATGAMPPVHTAPAINLAIEKLVVRGCNKRDASRMAAAFERSLMKLLAAGTLPDALRDCRSSPLVRLAPLPLRRPGDPAGFGEQLAASIMSFERDTRRRGGSR